MFPRIFSVKDHRRGQNVVRTSVPHSAIASCAICDQLPNRRMETWNLFAHLIQAIFASKFTYCFDEVKTNYWQLSFRLVASKSSKSLDENMKYKESSFGPFG